MTPRLPTLDPAPGDVVRPDPTSPSEYRVVFVGAGRVRGSVARVGHDSSYSFDWDLPLWRGTMARGVVVGREA